MRKERVTEYHAASVMQKRPRAEEMRVALSHPPSTQLPKWRTGTDGSWSHGTPTDVPSHPHPCEMDWQRTPVGVGAHWPLAEQVALMG
jgi:hypothetical protein